jgi:magnesium transporter
VKEASDTMSEMVNSAMTVNLAMVSVGQNEVVKRLAGWAALLAVPTLVASWYGMNFHHMPELAGENNYFILIGLTLAASTGLYIWLRRSHWL